MRAASFSWRADRHLVFTSYSLGTAPTKGSVTSFDPATGAFTYTRNSALGHTTTPNDFVTVIATDADGRQVTLRMNVAPTVPNNAPVANLTTTPTVGSLSGTVQTSTGKITATDADGDSLTYTASGLASGASVTFQSDGTFTYVTNIATSARHAAAKVGATAAQKNQSFTVTVSDGFGGNTNVVVSVPIYAVNAVPIVTSGGEFLGTVGLIKAEDPDGDSISTTRNPSPGSSGYTLSNGGSLTSGSLSLGTGSLTFPSGGWPVTIRVYDGYHVVVNGVVTSDLAYGQKVLG
ncbi:Ig-like domain-containing protein [Mycolicibacterium austroafricanum]|uniref:Ig-like domain-containing protein n=1 Tax=Mycolicibacterium austroafricanum TaxID=39687 RepID=UPI001CA38161|nr:VCBS domain-containing protein [Mycolicibacterium austroafricanum]QZT64514.1 VCBS domain-containing protein [Mycolicibacterium austroafricanum]